MLQACRLLRLAMTAFCLATGLATAADAKTKALLVVVGGNSECSRDKGLWPIKAQLAREIATRLGIGAGDIETHYYSWTGDRDDHPGCWPGHLDYLRGAKHIRADLPVLDKADGRRLVIIGWSNGGATAYELACELTRKDPMRADLLITLDAVSVLTRSNAPCRGPGSTPIRPARTWLAVYTHSSGWARLRSSNFLAWGGGAWNDTFPAGDGNRARPLMFLQPADHGDVARMWRECVVASEAFAAWATGGSGKLQSREPCRGKPR